MKESAPERAVILVADDDSTLRSLTAGVLRSDGLRVVEAADGEAAMTLYREAKPQLVLLDVDMPKVDGFEVCRFIREQSADDRVAIAMMTGLDDTDSIERAYRLGATDFLTKPFPLPLLSHRVRYILRTHLTRTRLERSLQDLAAAQRFAKIASWSIDLETGAFAGSPELLELLDLGPATESGSGELRALTQKIHPDDRAAVQRVIGEAMRDRASFQVECRVALEGDLQRHVFTEGRPHLRDGVAIRLDAVSQDITGRRALEARVAHLEEHDAVTGLSNRARLSRHLGRLVEAHAEGSVLLIGIRQLSRINQTEGHDAGDAILQEVALRLTQAVRMGDFVSRFQSTQETILGRVGGAEFAMVLSGVGSPRDLASIATRILERLGEPYRVDHRSIEARFRIGLTSWPGDERDAARLLQTAEAALRSVDIDDPTGYAFHRPEIHLRATELAALEKGLRAAIQHGELHLAYQPKFSLASGEIQGVEALLRWRREDGEHVSPAEFIPLAEESGLIRPIGRWVIDRALQQHRAWLDTGVGAIPIAINLSTKQLDDEDLLGFIQTRCREVGVDPRALELEVTESCFIGDAARAISFLDQAHRLGMQTSLDDFGTGYSSLSYLKKLPLDTLKIDRSFVSGIDRGDSEPELTNAIIAIGTILGLRVVAEGVETEEQWNLLQEWGCTAAQGFLMSRPLPAPELEGLLRRGSWAPKPRDP